MKFSIGPFVRTSYASLGVDTMNLQNSFLFQVKVRGVA